MLKLQMVLSAVCTFILLHVNSVTAQVAQVALESELIVAEEALHSTNICIVVTSGTVTVTSSLTLSTLGDSATPGVDYISISEQSLSIQPGETRKCITFNVIEDDIVEGEESLTVQIQSSMLVIGIPDTAEVNIVDTSRITIGLVSPTFTATEGVQALVCAAIRNGTIARAVGFTVESLPIGTASSDPGDQDYIPDSQEEIFDPRSPTPLIACTNFIIIDDNLFPTLAEADEYFVVTLTSSDNVDVIPGESSANITIHDNDGVNVSLASSTLSVTEGDSGENTSVSVCLKLNDIHDGLQRDVHFHLTIVAHILASRDDFSPLGDLTITFTSNSLVNSSSCAQYVILGDDLKEGAESFRVSVTADNSVDILHGDTTVDITIQDNRDVIQECVALTNPSNGKVEFSSPPLNGSVAVYSCDEGYIVSGEERVTCLSTTKTVLGIWSEDPPTCDVIDCGIPSHPGANGNVTYTDTTFRAIASYSCMPECYMLEPDVETRMCLANGSWSGETPSCHLIDCGLPPVVTDCELSVPSTTSCGSVAVYQPQSGFTLEGDVTITCRVTGEWRGDAGFTICRSSACPLVPDPVCGSVAIISLSVGSTANVSCDVGCTLSTPGITQSVCMPNEEWSPPPPTCDVVTCPPLADPENGRVLQNTTLPKPYQTVVNISCTEGFHLEGSVSRMCLSDGTWSGMETECVLVECELVVPENGNATVNGTGLGSVVEYTCDIGFDLIGNSLQVCLENDIWSDDIPICELADCGPPPVQDFTGQVNYSNTTYGNSALYICPGDCSSNFSSCQENGEWTALMLDCFICQELESPQHGDVNLLNDSLIPGSLASYECDSGHTSTDTLVRRCTCDGWNGTEPICVEVEVMNPGGPDDILIIVIAAVGGSVVIVGLCVCTILVWCCLIKNNSKWNHFRRTQRNNYKGNTSYVLPYTIYANRSSASELLASNNRNSNNFDNDHDPLASLSSTHSGFLDRRRSTLDELPSARGSEFGTMHSDSKAKKTVRGSRFGVNKQMDPLSSSPAESDTSTWDRSWAESSLSVNPTADRHFYDGSEELDDASSVLTTSTMPMSEYQRRVLAADPQLNAKVPASILKKK